MHPSALHIVFDGIFNQIAQRQRQFHFVHLRHHRPEALKHQLDIGFCRDGPQPFQDQLQQIIDVDGLNVQICIFLVHFYQRKQIVDDLIFPVDLRRNVLHKLPVQLHRHLVALHGEGIRQHLHGCQRRFQLMGHVGNKFLTAVLLLADPADHIVVRIGNGLGLRVIGNRNDLLHIPFRQIFHGMGDFSQRFHENHRSRHRQHDDHRRQRQLDEHALGLQGVPDAQQAVH